MVAILAHREVAPLLSDEHFSVDGTLVKARASMKSFQPKADAAPPDDEGPGDPPAPDTAPEPTPSETPAETDPRPIRNRSDAAQFPPSPQCRGRFQGREALERHACLNHRSRCAALQKIPRHRCDAVFHGACADGKP
jgi:hypothetical protein